MIAQKSCSKNALNVTIYKKEISSCRANFIGNKENLFRVVCWSQNVCPLK